MGNCREKWHLVAVFYLSKPGAAHPQGTLVAYSSRPDLSIPIYGLDFDPGSDCYSYYCRHCRCYRDNKNGYPDPSDDYSPNLDLPRLLYRSPGGYALSDRDDVWNHLYGSGTG